MKTKSGSTIKPTTQAIANTINLLKESLKLEYGSDYAFNVVANGKYLATDSMFNGVAGPEVQKEEGSRRRNSQNKGELEQ